MMSLDPHVVSVFEQTRHLTPLPTGSGSATLGPYVYDGSGNIRSIGPAGNQEQYVYDSLGRLTSATAGVTNTQTYQYDAFGNRTVVNRTGSNCTGDTACEQLGTYLAETNHLNNNGAAYNAAGDLTAYVADQYAYDAAGMLVRASVSGDRQYLYTAFDERIAVYDGTFNWRWTVRSEDGKVLREFTSTNDPSTGALGVASRQWVKDYVWRNGQLLATENRKAGGGTVTEHYHLDHLGTPRLVTDGTGLKLATHTYYAFGAELMGTPESPEAGMKFTGHERDITGSSDALDNMHARYYSSLTGRFLSVDPVLDIEQAMANPQMWNRYGYALNNPLVKVDPDGRQPTIFQRASAYLRPYADAAILTAHALSGAPLGLDEGASQIAGALDLTARTLNLGTATGSALGNHGDSYDLGMALSSDVATASDAFVALGTVIEGGRSVSSAFSGFTRAETAEMSGMLRDAARGKGNFGIGSASTQKAEAMGQAWVGPEARVASDGRTLISKDGLRQYRPPSYKPKLKKTQANFEFRASGEGQRQSNAHVDVND
jgi:RHS repeat-associated protein